LGNSRQTLPNINLSIETNGSLLGLARRRTLKVGSFLILLAGRASESKSQVELPVSRYDIADYLAVSVETVCRSITDLQQRGGITVAGKRPVKILNRGALEDRSGESSMVAEGRLRQGRIAA
jgi:CRP-like cAMP-binding protein